MRSANPAQVRICFPGSPESSREPEQNPGKTAPLWLAVHLPGLCLEALYGAGRKPDPDTACLVVTDTLGSPRVLAMNRPAARLGVRPGMPVNAAHALGRMSVRVRAVEAERRCLQRLALCAMRFTPVVSLDPPDGLLLEIRGSLGLFGGLGNMLRELREDLVRLQHEVELAVAPTPAAAAVLARARYRQPVLGRDALRRALAQVPVTQLRLPADPGQALRRIGIRTVTECLRLPRADLARRLGPDFVRLLDRLIGTADDPRQRVPLPERFDDEIDLSWDIPGAGRDKGILMHGARILLNALGDYLRVCCRAASLLQWRLLHADRTVSEFSQGLRVPRQDPSHIAGLLDEQMNRLVLRNPVIRIGLRVERFVAWQPEDSELFADVTGAPAAHQEAQLVDAFLDHLCARLGGQLVGGVATCPDHRPERAWRWLCGGRPADGARRHRGVAPVSRIYRRPLWLLPEPRRLERASFVLCSPRERIESGWWDGFPISRDYYQARTPGGDRLWVFRDLREPGQWYLHGYFA